MPFGLTEKEHNAIRDVFRLYPKVEEVIIFGSRAMGTDKPGSDIDLAVKGRDLERSDIIRMTVRLDELPLAYKYDVIDYESISNPDLTKHIDTFGASFYTRQTAPTNWKSSKFKDLLQIPLRNGLTKPTRIRGEGFKMVNMGEIFSFNRMNNVPMQRVPLSETEKNNYLLKSGDLLFARQSLVTAGAGKCSIFLEDKEDVTFEGHLIRARINKRLADPLFLYYFFQSPEGRYKIGNIVEVTAAAGIRGSDLYHIEFHHPDLQSQRQIAAILSSLDDKIEINLQMNQTLEAMAQAIFKEWFVDFRFPGFDGKLVDGLPKGWRTGTLRNLSSLSKETVSPSAYPEKEFYHYSIPAFDEGRLPVREPGRAILSNKFMVKSNSILISKLNPRFPRIWPVSDVDETDSISSTEFLILQPAKTFYYSFCACFLRQEHTLDTMKGLAAGTSGSHQRIKPEDILAMSLTIPDDKTLKGFEGTVRAIFSRSLGMVNENQTLAQLRDSLLPKLMSGKIIV